MKQNKKNIISDSHSEDRGYSRSHKQTKGGLEAYARGERPLSYWKKTTIISAIFNRIENISREHGSKNKQVIAKTLTYADKTVSDYIGELKSLSHEQLKENFLQFTGVHYTGNYYRHTNFYGLVSEEEITKDICSRYKPPIRVQLKLNFKGETS